MQYAKRYIFENTQELRKKMLNITNRYKAILSVMPSIDVYMAPLQNGSLVGYNIIT